VCLLPPLLKRNTEREGGGSGWIRLADTPHAGRGGGVSMKQILDFTAPSKASFCGTYGPPAGARGLPPASPPFEAQPLPPPVRPP